MSLPSLSALFSAVLWRSRSTLHTGCDDGGGRASPPGRGLALLGDPVFDVTPSETKVPPNSEAGWASPAVAPPVDGGDGHSQVGGEFWDGEERFERFHILIL